MIEWVSVQARQPDHDSECLVAYTIDHWPPQYGLAKYAWVKVRCWGDVVPAQTVRRWQMDGHEDLRVTHWSEINEPDIS